MILDVDLGNTRIKWRLSRGNHIVARGNALDAHTWCEEMVGLTKASADLKRIRLASVRTLAANEMLRQSLQAQLGIRPEFALSQSSLAGVTNGYLEPERLGVDRWLALVAGYQRERSACVVVDAGSAITLDLVNASGRHLGGYIAPGLVMMRRALTTTAGISLGAEVQPLVLAPGHNTASAVAGAQGAMVCGLINEAIKQLGSPRLLFTGGDAEYLLPHYAGALLVPDLVLDGLALALPTP